MKKTFFVISACLFMASSGYSQLQTDICEDIVPSDWTAFKGRLSISNEHAKLGSQSVRWDWKSKDANVIVKSSAFASVAGNDRSTFVFWIYNEEPVKDKLNFVFYNEEDEHCRFDFNLNFKGWRTAWVIYHRDMTGKPGKGMNRLRIEAPKNVKKGTLFLDQVMYDATINPRSPMRDFQVPFVNLQGDKAANAHWNSLYTFSTTAHYLPLSAALSAQEKQDLMVIKTRFEKFVSDKASGSKVKNIQAIRKTYAYWDIRQVHGRIQGRTIFSMNDTELMEGHLSEEDRKLNKQSGVRVYTDFMLEVAETYRYAKSAAQRKELAEMFMQLLDHFDDQGWSFGSGMGALHHHGYNLTGFYTSCFLMKSVIEAQRKLDRTFRSMYWFSGLGRTLEVPEKMPVSNIDVFNTLLNGMLSAILMLEDGPEKTRYLKYYSIWLSKNLRPNPEISGAFKPDGAVFHHGTLYPAYGTGGYTGIAPILYVLSGTSFRVDQAAHQDFKNNLLMAHYYTNPYKWPVSISGRHPTGEWRLPDVPYAYMGLAGTPDGREAVDKEMAAVYLLVLKKSKDEFTAAFERLGIRPAMHPDGHWNLNYGLLDIHRRADWLLTIKGHNRYFVSHESYPAANVFGRYNSYGHLEVLFPQTKSDSGAHFRDAGWDWNLLPGTTTLYVPLDKLRADIKNVDDFSGVEEMLLTDQIFAGGTRMNKNGLFAMKLRGHDKYDMGSFRATKSWFTFDSLVVSLGSDITNSLSEYPTVTTLFQNYLEDNSDTVVVNGKAEGTFPYSMERKVDKPVYIIDNRKIGYYIEGGSWVELRKQTQISRDQKDISATEGNFASLLIRHGNAPAGQHYRYAMLIGADVKKMKHLNDQQQSNNPLYKVERQDSLVHKVRYASANLTGMAVFKAGQITDDAVLLSNNRPLLLMYNLEKDRLRMSVTDPDIALYEGEDDSPKAPDGKRQEVSIYSRTWFKTEPKRTEMQFEVKGIWKAFHQDEKYKISYKNGNSLISYTSQYGLVQEFELYRNER